jgi:hypothetical protein
VTEVLPPHPGPLGNADHPVIRIHHIHPFHVQALSLMSFNCPQYIGARACHGSTFSTRASRFSHAAMPN